MNIDKLWAEWTKHPENLVKITSALEVVSIPWDQRCKNFAIYVLEHQRQVEEKHDRQS
jgi:hypothetical protein